MYVKVNTYEYDTMKEGKESTMNMHKVVSTWQSNLADY